MCECQDTARMRQRHTEVLPRSGSGAACAPTGSHGRESGHGAACAPTRPRPEETHCHSDFPTFWLRCRLCADHSESGSGAACAPTRSLGQVRFRCRLCADRVLRALHRLLVGCRLFSCGLAVTGARPTQLATAGSTTWGGSAPELTQLQQAWSYRRRASSSEARDLRLGRFPRRLSWL